MTGTSPVPQKQKSAPPVSDQGTITAIRGSVVDVRCSDRLPPIDSPLLAGDDMGIVLDVLAHPDEQHVRASHWHLPRGFARGMAVTDTGGPLKAPVGTDVLFYFFASSEPLIAAKLNIM